MATVKIIIATHKAYRMPEDDSYLPLHVGAEGKRDASGQSLDLGFTKDNTGDNISAKNPYYCELTGLYWAWKNLECDYLGLVHYRRYFVLKKKSGDPFENVLNTEELNNLIARYQVIVPKKRRYYIETLYSHYAHTHYIQHLDMAEQIIREHYPEYAEAFADVMRQTSGYMFNMMVMERKLLNKYCTWIFDILSKLEKSVDDQGLSSYQSRFYGRVSEILFNVWLKHQLDTGVLGKDRIKEISCVYMESIHWGRKICCFLQAKLIHKKYENSF